MSDQDFTLPGAASRASGLSEKELLRLVELSPDATATFDREGRVTWASPGSNELFGEAAGASLVGRPIVDWVPPEERETVIANVRKLLAGESSDDSETVFVRADGTRFRAQVRTAAIRDSAGQPDGFIAVARSVDASYYSRLEHEMMAAVSRLFLSQTTLEEVFTQLAGVLRARLGFGAVGITLLDNAAGQMVRVSRAGGSKRLEMPERLSVAGTLTGLVASSGEPIVELDVGARRELRFAALQQHGAESYVCVPLRGVHGILGALAFASEERRPEVARLAGTLEVVASYLAVEIERKRAAQDLAKSEARYRVFVEHFHGIAYRWAPKTAETNIMEGAVEEITGYSADDFRRGRLRWFDLVHPDDLSRVQEAESLLVALPGFRLDDEYRIFRRDGSMRWVNDVAARLEDDGDGSVVVQGAIYDVTEAKESKARIEASEEKLRRVFNSTHDAIVVHDSKGNVLEVNETWLKVYDVMADEALAYSVADYSAPDEEMLARLPSHWSEALAGRPQFFEWKARRPRDGSLFDVEVYLCAMTLRGSQTVLGNVRDVSERKRAAQEALEATARLRRTVEGAVGAMGTLVEIRDPYTAGHERRVAQLAVAIAVEMGITGETLETLRLAGEVHDIGKVAVPAEILTKPGRLQETEFAIVKMHPVAGADILAQVEFGAPVAEIVRWHHERLDGSGYPDGREGEAIPLGARVIAVADVVEAMASHRPYRPALGIEAALAEIGQGAGRLYDDDAVAACQRAFAAGFEFTD